MDYFPGGDLGKRLEYLGCFPEETAKKCAAQIVLMLEELRSLGIVHRDMKPQNILVNHKGMLQLIDFGLSEGGFNEMQIERNTFAVGTAGYMPPEVQFGKSISYSGDYWALGCMIYEFLYGVPPFNRDTEEETHLATLRENAVFKDDDDFHWTEDEKDIITKLLNKNPDERLGAKSIEEIKQHPWFSDIDWNNVENVPEIPNVPKPEKSEFDFDLPAYDDIRADIESANRSSAKRLSVDSIIKSFGEEEDELSGFNQISDEATIELNNKALEKTGKPTKMAKFQERLREISIKDDDKKIPFTPPKSRTPCFAPKNPFSE